MIAFLVFIIIALSAQLVRVTYVKNKKINLMGQLQDSLLAVIADSPDYKKSINKYFFYMEHTLKVQDFEAYAKDMCLSLNIVPEYDHMGLISIHTLKELIAYNAKYAKQTNVAIKAIIDQDDDTASINE